MSGIISDNFDRQSGLLKAVAATGGGKIGTVESSTTSTAETIDATSYTASSYVKDTITPSAAGSKIFVYFCVSRRIYQGSSLAQIYRDVDSAGFASALASYQIGGRYDGPRANQTSSAVSGIFGIDTPTYDLGESIEYKLYCRDDPDSIAGYTNNGVGLQYGDTTSSMTLMEILA